MKAPKAVRENNDKMTEELKSEKLEYLRKFLWNTRISDDEANNAIESFNTKWLAAGGIQSSTITKR
jgi:hypothetical protein